MSDAQTLLARCRELGAKLTSAPDDKLKVRAPVPLPEELQAELKQRKAEVLALLTEPSLFPCPACDGPVRLDPPDENLPTRIWTCPSCGAWGATRAAAAFPVVWVSVKAVQ
jgi:predicted RNA-binding Zn-ribbon protein involved in translation (DUF1610 family)